MSISKGSLDHKVTVNLALHFQPSHLHVQPGQPCLSVIKVTKVESDSDLLLTVRELESRHAP